MNEQNAFSLLFGVFMLFTCRDVFYGQTSQQDAEPKNVGAIKDHRHLHRHHHVPDSSINIADKAAQIPPTAPGLSTVTIQYCHSCGYRQAFEEVSKMLNDNFPDMRVIGELHDPGWIRGQIVNLLFVAKFAILGMIFMNINPFIYFNRETPGWWNYLTQSKLSSTLMILFLANTIESNMMSTGAFEIFYNDLPIWSKMETGKMPTAQDIIAQIQAQRVFDMKRVGDFRT